MRGKMFPRLGLLRNHEKEEVKSHGKEMRSSEYEGRRRRRPIKTPIPGDRRVLEYIDRRGNKIETITYTRDGAKGRLGKGSTKDTK